MWSPRMPTGPLSSALPITPGQCFSVLKSLLPLSRYNFFRWHAFWDENLWRRHHTHSSYGFLWLNPQTVCAESANVTSKGVAITKPRVLNYPVHNLTAMKLVNTEAVCESVVSLFGVLSLRTTTRMTITCDLNILSVFLGKLYVTF